MYGYASFRQTDWLRRYGFTKRYFRERFGVPVYRWDDLPRGLAWQVTNEYISRDRQYRYM
jgi:hypothetical protein